MGKSTISMAIFNSYVGLPEGNSCHGGGNHSEGLLGISTVVTFLIM